MASPPSLMLAAVEDVERDFVCARCGRTFWARLSLVHRDNAGRILSRPAKVWIAKHDNCAALDVPAWLRSKPHPEME